MTQNIIENTDFCISTCLFTSLPFPCLSLSIFFYLSVSVYLSTFFCTCVSTCLSLNPFFSLYTRLSPSPPVSVSVCLSMAVFIPVCLSNRRKV